MLELPEKEVLTYILRKYYNYNIMRTVLQVPLNIDLRKEAEKQALAQGFSSLQEAVRVFLKQMVLRRIKLSLQDKD